MNGVFFQLFDKTSFLEAPLCSARFLQPVFERFGESLDAILFWHVASVRYISLISPSGFKK